MRDEHLDDGVSVLCLAAGGAPILLTGTTVKTTLATIRVPARMLGPHGKLRVECLASRTNNANAITLSVDYGALNLGNYNVVSQSGYRTLHMMHNRGTESSQVVPASNAAFGVPTTGAVNTAGAVDTTQDQMLTISGTLANAGDSFTLESYSVEVLRG